jgi:uncharacterized protein YdhG (YjbR/CyaY superfamily)
VNPCAANREQARPGLYSFGSAALWSTWRGPVFGNVPESRTRFGYPSRAKLPVVATAEVDLYLATLDEPKRSTLEALRTSILEAVPDAEQCISYGMPAFKVADKTVAGFAAFKQHLSYLPHSGSVLSTLAGDVAGYETSKGALRFAIDKPLPKHLVKKLITTRMVELGLA